MYRGIRLSGEGYRVVQRNTRKVGEICRYQYVPYRVHRNPSNYLPIPNAIIMPASQVDNPFENALFPGFLRKKILRRDMWGRPIITGENRQIAWPSPLKRLEESARFRTFY